MADSIREALTKAIAEDETKVDDTPAVEAAVEVKPEVSIADPTAPVIGASAEAAKDPAKTPAPTAQAADKAEAPVAAEAAKPAAAAQNVPASWKATERAHWDKVPPEARAAILRREAETQRALSTTADARRHQDTFKASLAPFQPLFDAYGVKDPMQAIMPLMQTRAALEVGTPDQKAELISNLVYQFKVDIQKLDGFLAGGPRAQVPIQEPQKFNPQSMPELQPLFALAEQFKSAQSAKVEAAIAPIAQLPHFEELRDDMADLLDNAANKGRTMSLQDAYDHAARLAGLAPSLAQAAASNVSEAAAMLARSRKAASSVAGAPKGAAGSKPTTLRDTIVAAMEG